jgi:hypothetical protein
VHHQESRWEITCPTGKLMLLSCQASTSERGNEVSP